MPKQPKPNKTAADILTDAGRALFDNAEDWQASLAIALEVRRDTIRDWRSGRMSFGPDHGALDRLLALVTRREAELRQAKKEMQDWMRRNRDQGAGADRRAEGQALDEYLQQYSKDLDDHFIQLAKDHGARFNEAPGGKYTVQGRDEQWVVNEPMSLADAARAYCEEMDIG